MTFGSGFFSHDQDRLQRRKWEHHYMQDHITKIFTDTNGRKYRGCDAYTCMIAELIQ